MQVYLISFLYFSTVQRPAYRSNQDPTGSIWVLVWDYRFADNIQTKQWPCVYGHWHFVKMPLHSYVIYLSHIVKLSHISLHAPFALLGRTKADIFVFNKKSALIMIKLRPGREMQTSTPAIYRKCKFALPNLFSNFRRKVVLWSRFQNCV